MDTQRYDIEVELPNLGIEAEYGVDGKIILVPIRGSGPMTANVSKYDCKIVSHHIIKICINKVPS